MKAYAHPRLPSSIQSGPSGAMGNDFIKHTELRCSPCPSCPGGESAEEMQFRVDTIISKAPPHSFDHLLHSSYSLYAQVREYHRQYKEEGLNTRDVVIVAHGHFTRVLIARWIKSPLSMGKIQNAYTRHNLIVSLVQVPIST